MPDMTRHMKSACFLLKKSKIYAKRWNPYRILPIVIDAVQSVLVAQAHKRLDKAAPRLVASHHARKARRAAIAAKANEELAALRLGGDLRVAKKLGTWQAI